MKKLRETWIREYPSVIKTKWNNTIMISVFFHWQKSIRDWHNTDVVVDRVHSLALYRPAISNYQSNIMICSVPYKYCYAHDRFK